MKTKKLITIILLITLLALTLSGCGDTSSKTTISTNTRGDKTLQIHFIDVGQADAILIMGPHNQNIMIDAGKNDDGDTLVEYIKSQGVTSFKAVIGTHPHEDHIGGLDKIIQSFDVEKVYLPKTSSSTKTFRDVLAAVKAKGLKISTAKKGVEIPLEGMTAEFLAPVGSEYEEINNYSAVLKLTYGDDRFLLQGDAETLSEKEILSTSGAQSLKADLIKLGHHGSHSSSSKAYIAAVKPQYAVIMAGKDNDYKHPHQETMELMKAMKIPVYRTDQCGTIIAVSEGKGISFNVKSGDYSYGRMEGRQGRSDSDSGSSDEKQYTDSRGRGLIKGNINSKGEKIYHMPGGANYNKIEPEMWFKTENEAVKAGFRKAQR